MSEYKFDKTRKFRFDYAHPQSKVAIEINGGRWILGGHSSGSGIERDCVKASLAASLFWLLFPLTDSMITEQSWLGLIAHAINQREDQR